MVLRTIGKMFSIKYTHWKEFKNIKIERETLISLSPFCFKQTVFYILKVTMFSNTFE